MEHEFAKDEAGVLGDGSPILSVGKPGWRRLQFAGGEAYNGAWSSSSPPR